jgi:hypothetical protein
VVKNSSSAFVKTPTALRYWWLFAAFFGPFVLSFYPPWQINASTSAFLALRSGLVGLGIACLVYLLWKIECRLNRAVKPDRNSDRIILLLGILLWLVWFSTCQMILIASDEVNNADYSHTWHL